MKYLHLIWSNLLRKKLRSILTVLSIIVAFLLFGYLAAIRAAFTGGIDMAKADRLIVRHKVSIIQMLPVSYKGRIARIPGVVKVGHNSWFGGIYKEPSNFFPQIVVEPDNFFDLYPEFKLPDEQKKAWLATRTGAVVGRTTADRFGWKLGDRIPIQATIWQKKDGTATWEFDIVGIYDGEKKETDTTQFFFRYDYFDETRAFGKGEVGWYVIRVDDPSRAAEIAKNIDHEFANSPAETKSEPEKAFVQAFAKQIGDIGTILTAILSAVFFTILLVSGNTMAQAVRERREELGVLKAIGFTNSQVLWLVLAESCVLAFIGGAGGLALAWGLISNGDPTHGALPLFYFPPRDLLVGVVVILGLGIAAGIGPAIQAMRLNVAEALRRM